MITRKLLTALLLTASAALAQPFSIGIKAGVPMTGGLSDFSEAGIDVVTHTFSHSKQYIIGPMVELHLPLSLSIEADALYRPVNLSSDVQIAPGPGPIIHSSQNVSTWEFPALGKFRFPLLPILKPYVEAGPSFRKPGSGLSWFSNYGGTIGGGVELKLLRLRIAPEVRYTRWGSDDHPPPGVVFFPPSKQDQAEFLVGLSF
jgi:hypothetical protein